MADTKNPTLNFGECHMTKRQKIIKFVPYAGEALYQMSVWTPVGELRLIGSDSALYAVLWPIEKAGRVVLPVAPLRVKSHGFLNQVADQLDAYFVSRERVRAVPCYAQGSTFAQTVWQSLATVPMGQTTTYQALAIRLLRPSAARAIGMAVGRNPFSIILPCHRVVGSKGALTGFAGGLEAKCWLLEHEGARLHHGRMVTVVPSGAQS